MIIILSVVIVILMGMLGYVYAQLLNAQRRSGMVLQQQQQQQESVEHKLRTPIVAMQQSLSILADQVVGPLTEEQQKFIAVAQRNLERLNALIR